MQNKHSIYTILLFLFLVIFNFEGLSQKLITYKAENQPLNIVLTKISSISKVRFAFDDDYFSKMYVSFNVSNLTVVDFLKQLSVKFPINYRLIGGTWVIYKDEKKVVERPKPKVIEKTPVKPPTIISKRVVYKKERLWDLIGTVTDMKSGNRLKFCQLFIDEYTNPITNDLGFFSDEVVSTGGVRIKVNQPGYYPLDTALMLTDGKDIVLKLNPIWKVENTNVDSYSGLFQIDQTESSELIALNVQSGYNIPGIDQNDFMNSLQMIPGFDFSEKGSAGIMTRESSPSENLILMDGVQILNYGHLDGQLSSINSKFINQAFVSRGGFGVEYGNGSSGIIELTGKSGFGKTNVDFSANLLDANLFIGIPISKKVSISGSFRKSVVDYWPNYFYKNIVTVPVKIQTTGNDIQNGEIDKSFNNFYDVNMKIAYQPNSRSEVDFIFANGYDNQKTEKFGYTTDKIWVRDLESNWRNYGFGLDWKYRTKNLWYNTLSASYNQLDQKNGIHSGFNYNIANSTGYIHSDQDSNNTTEVLLKWKSEFSKKRFSYQFGAEYDFNKLKYTYIGRANKTALMLDDSISAVNNKHQGNLFFQSKYKLFNWLELTAGLRGLIDLSIPNLFIQPRAGIDLTPDEKWRFYYLFGRYIHSSYQTQRIGNDFNAVPVWFLSANTDQIIKSYHNILGGNYNHNGLFINIEGYRMKNSGKAAYFTNLNQSDNLNGIKNEIYTGSEIRQGVDAIIQYHHTIFNHSLSYSYSDSKEKFTGVNGDNYYPSFTNHHHKIQFNEAIAYSGWIASISYKYLTGRPYLLQNSTLEQFSLSRLPGFSQLDVSLVKQFSFNKLKFEAGAVLLNVLQTKNTKDIEFFSLGEAPSHFILKSTTSGIPFTPSFFITIKFD
jgi:ferric enterobactin receptor